MLNYSNLNDVEFEYLCKDIMQSKLKVELHSFARGKDKGIDLCDDVFSKDIIIQVKHYVQSTTTQVVGAIKKEIKKVDELKPKQYYVCTSRALTPQNIKNIYDCFSAYMDSPNNIISVNEIDSFLNDPDNQSILKRHYKLWIESTNILQNALTNGVFVDCEVLLASIEKDKRFFVQTKAYDDALSCLKKNKALFIVGNPGVGKTTTSKMLVLFFATNGYRVRYTTNVTDLKELKKSISMDPETKEIILIDDCLGQAYFRMKESQSDELLSLIKYVSISKNKLLILNSRITIYNEARYRNRELSHSFDNGEFVKIVLDMNNLSDQDKARIFYNHLYFNGISESYYSEVLKDKRYLSIIKHKNYNPRLIEFICDPRHLATVAPSSYYSFINDTLNNPREMWRDEYENRIQKFDRLLLLTVYSLSDKAVMQKLVKEAFEKWITTDPDYDKTVNQFEISLQRLMEGFVLVVDKKTNPSTPFLMVSNPSLNDFLDSYMDNDIGLRDEITNNAVFVEQIVRVLQKDKFNDWMKASMKDHSIDNYSFTNSKYRAGFIAKAIITHKILDNHFQKDVFEFMLNPTTVYDENLPYISAEYVLKEFFSNKDLKEFYKLNLLVHDFDLFDKFIDNLSLDELIGILPGIRSMIAPEDYEYYRLTVESALENAIEDYCSYIYADDYNPDVESAVKDAYYLAYDEITIDEYQAQENIEEEVKVAVLSEVERKLQDLPDGFNISHGFLNSVSIDVIGADDLVSSYLSDYEEDDIAANNTTFEDEIESIFEREYWQ